MTCSLSVKSFDRLALADFSVKDSGYVGLWFKSSQARQKCEVVHAGR